MSKRLVLSTGVAAFAAGVAVGARWPHSTHILSLLLEKLGFDLSEIVFMFWDPEANERAAIARELSAPQPRAKRIKAPRQLAIKEPLVARPQAVVVKVRRFSSRPILSAA